MAGVTTYMTKAHILAVDSSTPLTIISFGGNFSTHGICALLFLLSKLFAMRDLP